MNNKLKPEELNYENFNIFVLGYDLLQKELNELELDIDTAFYVCHKVYKDFLSSLYNDETKSEYTCMSEFINNTHDNYITNILDEYYNVSKDIEEIKEETEQIMYVLSGWTEDMHCSEVWRRESIWIDTPDENNWENIITEFNYYCQRANSLGYYAKYNWCISLSRLKVCKDGSTYPESLVLKMNKSLYQNYKNIMDYPITPSINMHLSGIDDKNECYKYELVDWKNELYYDKNGNVPQFKTCAEAWKYIFQNNLIK